VVQQQALLISSTLHSVPYWDRSLPGYLPESQERPGRRIIVITSLLFFLFCWESFLLFCSLLNLMKQVQKLIRHRWLVCRDFGDISFTYVIWAIMLVPLYYSCIWYSKLKINYPDSVLKYF